MALVPVITVAKNSDCSEITITDATGEDNLASSTKYSTGSTNTNISKAEVDVTDIIITPPDNTPVAFNYTSGSDWVPVNTLSITYDDTDLGTLDSGVWLIDYYVWSNADFAFTATLTANSATVTMSSDVSAAISNGDYIRFTTTGDYEDSIYRVQNVSTTTITLNKPFTGTAGSGVASFKGWKASNYVLIDCAVNCCIDEKLGKLSDACCDECGDKELNYAMKLELLRVGAEKQAECGKYTEAQKTIDLLLSYCNSDTDCGCS